MRSPLLLSPYLYRATWLLEHVGYDTPLGLFAGYASRSKVSAPPSEPLESQSQKAAVLDHLVDRLNKKYGRGTIMSPADNPEPMGRITEIYGPESSGKTTLALLAMAEVQKLGGVVGLVDVEHALDQQFATKLGLRPDNFFVTQPSSAEEALDIVEEMVNSGAFSMIALDSVAALAPKAEVEGDMGAQQMGLQARLMSKALRKLTPMTSKMECSLLFINQLRFKVGVLYGNPETTSGGMALKYYASVRIEVRKKELLGDSDNPRGIRCKATVKKNKCSPPSRVAELAIMFDRGLDHASDIVDTALSVGVLTSRPGGNFKLEDRPLQVRGRDKLVAYLTGEGPDKEAGEQLGEEIKRLVMAKVHSGVYHAVEGQQRDEEEDEHWQEEGGEVPSK